MASETIHTIVLGSQSPRRHELIKSLGIPVEIKLQSIEEVYPDTIPLREVPVYLAQLKSQPFESLLQPGELLITVDTVVLLGQEILGKPKDEADACNILRKLNNQVHEVISGVCLKTRNRTHTFSEITEVHFGQLSERDIVDYVTTYKPMDKAGAYAIQERIGMLGIKKIVGCFYNVMGLPVYRIREEIGKMGLVVG